MSIGVTTLYDGPDPSGFFAVGIGKPIDELPHVSCGASTINNSVSYTIRYDSLLVLQEKINEAIESFKANEGENV